jgi:hypothetical protein
MVPVAQWLERLTVDEEVEGSTPFRHPRQAIRLSPLGLFLLLIEMKALKNPPFVDIPEADEEEHDAKS